MNWISVKDERPLGLKEDDYESVSEDVLIYDKNLGILVGRLIWECRFHDNKYEIEWCEKQSGCGCCSQDLEVTHWMKVPEPPEED